MPNISEPSKNVIQELNDTDKELLEYIKNLNDKFKDVEIQVNANEKEVLSHLGVIATLYKEDINTLGEMMNSCKFNIEEVKDQVSKIHVQTASLTNGGMQKALESALTTVIQNWGDINLATKVEREKRVSKVTVAIITGLGSLASAMLTYYLTHP